MTRSMFRTRRYSARLLGRVRRQDAGMTTAEYAVGTVATAGLGGILITILTSDAFRELLWELITKAISAFFG